MSRIEEIEQRMSEISAELENENSDVDALGEEVKILKEERNKLLSEIEKRAALRKDVAGGAGKVIKTFEEEKPLEERKYTVDSAEYRTAYLKKLQGKELSLEERAAVYASAAIPTETMNQIVGRLERSPLLAAVDMTSIPGNITYPVEGTVNAASWVAMGTAATDSADTISSISLSAYKLIKTVEITADVAAMSIPAFESWLVNRLANKIELAIDAAILTGTGTNQATGILKSGEIDNTGTFTKAAMKYKDLMAIIAAIPTQYLAGASFVMPRALFFKEVIGMEDTAGNRVVVLDPQAPAKFNVIGYPVIIDDNCTADTVIFGDLKEYKFNFAKPIEVTADNSVAFRTGSTVYRAMCLADGKVADKNAFAVFTRSST